MFSSKWNSSLQCSDVKRVDVLADSSSFNCLSTAARGASKWQYYCALSTCRNVAPHMYWKDRTLNYCFVNLAIFVHGMKKLKNAFLRRTESLICRMSAFFASPSLLRVMASFTGNSEEEAVFEDMPDESFKRKNPVSSLRYMWSTVR